MPEHPWRGNYSGQFRQPNQHPDENGRGTAVEVWRCRERDDARWEWSYFSRDECDPETGDEPGVWRSQADDALLLGVVEAARKLRAVVASMDEVDDGSGSDLGNYMTHVANAEQEVWDALDAWRPTDG